MSTMIGKTNLFSADGPLEWTVHVGYTASGDILVHSSKRESEWSLVIPAESALDLNRALMKHGSPCPGAGHASADAVELLRQHFGEYPNNPFEDIRAYLDLHRIPSEDAHWT